MFPRNALLLMLPLIVVGILLSSASGQEPELQPRRPAPPTDVRAADAPGDVGTQLIVEWTLSSDDVAGAVPRKVVAYEIYRRSEGEQEFRRIADTTYQKNFFRDERCERGVQYWYQVSAIGPDGTVSERVETPGPAIPRMQFVDTTQLWFGVLLLVVCASVTYYIEAARGGRDLKVRKIAGLEAVDEAVGRATEMGRPCLFVPGIQDVNDIQTIAGITILSRVSRLVAEYDARIDVPTCRSLVMTTCRETVAAAYLAAGRPDAYREDDIYYLTDEQFGYVAGVQGTMVRDKPAACFYMGSFFAESLLLAETGNSIGAIQIAGTAQPSQLPFFVAACDYTLIGEEFFAASAYLSGEPHQLGSLKGQDVGKVIGVGLLLLACGLATAASIAGFAGLGGVGEALEPAVSYIRDHILGTQGIWP